MVTHLGDDRAPQEGVRERLVSLGPQRLADELLRLAARTDEAAESVARLISTPEENIRRFKAKLAGLRRRRKFIDWQEAPDFARKLKGLLADLSAGVDDPRAGVELVAEFFKCDRSILARCDDSSGVVGDIFRFDARKLFIHYATGCTDRAWLSDRLLNLYAEDEYGVRTVLLEKAGEFLPRSAMRKLVDHLWERAESEPKGSYAASHWWIGVKLLARQLGDAARYEKAWLASCPRPSAGVCMDIARVYLETGEAETALAWMERVPTAERFRAEERDRLLVAIYERLGDRAGMAEAAWRLFLNHRSAATLDTLLRAIGESERERVIEEQVRKILEEEQVSYADAAFLVEVGRIEEASAYLLRHAAQLNGDRYTSLLPLAESMEREGHWLAAVVIYRALLESILRRAQSRYYRHGVRYLKKLDKLAAKIEDWREFLPHESYKQRLLKDHGRKRSFWARYNA